MEREHLSQDQLEHERAALAIVEACIDLEPAARAGELDRLCGTDTRLRRKVTRLLRVAEAPGPLDTRLPRPWQHDRALAQAPLPERIGRFRVVDRIGEGGMGIVVKAVRDDGVYEQSVAIKLMRGDITSAAAFERFTQERRILARLDAPSIARILDGGTHEGQPYLVMELVEGRTITEHAGALQLGLPARVVLFMAVCAAVQSAHRALVVHADLKPSNILVDTAGQVKLVDFGVARLLEDGASAPGLIGLTRAYAPPERRAGAPATVAADVYSLGAVLYELLTGHLPARDGGTCATGIAAAGPPDDAMPWPQPSRAPGVPDALARQLRGDLDAIILKAVAADPAGRYDDVAALISDLRRWQAHVPVSARPATLGLRAARFIARHRRGLALTALAGTVLLCAALVSTMLYLRAEAARVEANARFADVRSAARYLLFQLMPRLEVLPDSLPLRAEVADVSQRYLDRLAASPGASPDVRLEAATGLWRLAQVQAKAGSANLARPDLAERNLAAATRLVADMEGARARVLRAELHLDQLSLASDVQANEARTRTLLELARASSRAAAGDDPLFPARFHALETTSLVWQGQYRAAQASARAGLALVPDVRSLRAFGTRASLLDGLAEAIYYDGRPAEALPIYRDLLAMFEEAHARLPDDPRLFYNLYRARWALGTTLLELGQIDEAIMHLRRGLGETEIAMARNPRDEEAARSNRVAATALAQALARDRRGVEAVRLVEAIITRDRAAWRRDPDNPRRARDYGYSLVTLSEIHESAAMPREACAVGRRAKAMLATLKARGWYTTLDADYNERRLDARIAASCRLPPAKPQPVQR